MPIFDAGARIAAVGAGVGDRLTSLDRNRDEVQARNAEFKQRKALAEAQTDPEFINESVEAIRAQNQELIAKQTANATYSAFQRFAVDFKPRHINNLINQEPQFSETFGNMIRVERLNPVEDQDILVRNGIGMTGEGELNEFNPNRHLKAILPDGSTELFDAVEAMALTGYFKRADDEELERMIKLGKLFGDPDKGFAPGGLEKDARFVADTTGRELDDVTNALFTKRTAGLEPGQQQIADETVNNMEAEFTDSGGFFRTDFTVQENRIKAAPHIRRYEALTGAKLSAKDRADLKDLNTLVQMADITEATLTDEVTGFYDSWLRGVKNYFSEQVDAGHVDAIKAQSAYAAFRNTVRHALFGATLTDGEIAAFNEAFGTLRQQLPAVITQFQTALNQTKSKLATIAQLNDPYLAHYYMGKTDEDVNIIIKRLDERLELVSQLQGNKPGEIVKDTNKLPGTEPPPLETFFGPRTVQ